MTEYKRLGDYIREVNVRNRDLKVTKLVGLTIDKAFIPSVANVIGTDLSNYKVIQREQFACSLMQVSRDGKMPVAMFEEDEAIMSPAYPMFEITDKTVLMPQYLMMWFSRSEFDREASYYAVGGVRGSLTWEDFCNMNLPIPSITRQREIVSEYETLTNRIRLNNQMIQHLEATAQALYRKTFVDNIDKENLPEGWRMGMLGDYVELSQGIQVEVEDQSPIKHNGYNRFIRIIDYTPNTSEPPRYVNISNERYFSTRGDVIMIRYGDAGTVCRRLEGIIANNLFKITPIKTLTRNYIYHFLKSDTIQKLIKGSAASSTMPAITHKAVKDLECIIPPISVVQEFDTIINIIEKDICLKLDEISKLTELQSLLLAKMGQ